MYGLKSMDRIPAVAGISSKVRGIRSCSDSKCSRRVGELAEGDTVIGDKEVVDAR